MPKESRKNVRTGGWGGVWLKLCLLATTAHSTHELPAAPIASTKPVGDRSHYHSITDKAWRLHSNSRATGSWWPLEEGESFSSVPCSLICCPVLVIDLTSMIMQITIIKLSGPFGKMHESGGDMLGRRDFACMGKEQERIIGEQIWSKHIVHTYESIRE